MLLIYIAPSSVGSNYMTMTAALRTTSFTGRGVAQAASARRASRTTVQAVTVRLFYSILFHYV